MAQLRNKFKIRIQNILRPLAGIGGRLDPEDAMASPGAVSGALGPVSLLFDEATDLAAHQYIVNIFAFMAGKTFFLATETTEEHINTDSLVATLTKVCACVHVWCVCVHVCVFP